MQAAAFQKKDTNHNLTPEQKSGANSSVKSDKNGNFETGVPLFLQQSVLPPSYQTPQILRQITEKGQEENLQTELTIGMPGDRYEHEAKRVAELVTQKSKHLDRPRQTRPFIKDSLCRDDLIQRQIIPEKNISHSSPKSISIEKSILSANDGSKLPQEIRDTIEPVLNADLSRVLVHDDDRSHQLAKNINAKAFTHHHNIFIGAGQSIKDLKLMAHEATHTVQQTKRTTPVIQRYPDDEYESPPPTEEASAISDEVLAQLLRNEEIPVLLAADLMGGLRGMETTHPLSFEMAEERLNIRFGIESAGGIYENEPRIRRLVDHSNVIINRLYEMIDRYADTDQWTAHEYISVIHDHYSFSYAGIVESFAENGEAALVLLEIFIGGDPYEITDTIAAQADAAQAELVRLEEERAEQTEVGESEIGNVVATQEILFWWDDTVILESLIEPTYGTATHREALAWARISGRAVAVKQIQGRYYIYRLNHQYDYDDLQAWRETHRTDLVRRPTARGMTVVTTDGVVLNTPDGSRFFSGSQYRTGEEDYATAASIINATNQSLTLEQKFRLFKDMVRSRAFRNLEDAKTRLTSQLDQFFQLSGFHSFMNIDSTAGAALQEDTAHLRRLMIQAAEMGNRLGESPSEEERDALAQLLSQIGEIQAHNPLAAMFIQDFTTDLDQPLYPAFPGMVAPITPGSVGLGPEELIVDRLAGMRSGGAAWEGAQEIGRRIENVKRVRRHLLEDPDAPLKLTVLHDQVMSHFEPLTQTYIKGRRFINGMAQLGEAIGLTIAEIAIVVTGTLIGGPIGFALTTGASLYGTSQAVEAFENLETLEAMSQLDLEGRVLFASQEQVESARFWAYVGAGLTLLDVAGFASTARSMTRMRSVLTAPELTVTNRQTQRNLSAVAEMMGETEESLVHSLRSAQGNRRIQLNRQIEENMALITARSQPIPGGSIYWFDNLSDGARRVLRENDTVAAAYRAMDDDVRRLFTRCASPCEITINPPPTLSQARRINRLIELNQIRHLPEAQHERIMAKLKTYFQNNLDNLDQAIRDLPEPGRNELFTARYGNPVDPHVQPEVRHSIGDRFEAIIDYRAAGSVPAHMRDPIWSELNSGIASARVASGIQRAQRGGVVAAARHDIQGLDILDNVHGYSPNAHPQGRAGVSRELEAPDYLPNQATEHAEQDTLGQIAASIRRAREAGQTINLEGRTIWMRVEQTVCQSCRLGLTSPNLPEGGWGVIRRFSERHQELRIVIAVQNSNEMLEVMGGQIVHHIPG